MKLGLLGYTSGSIYNRTAKIGVNRLEQSTLGLTANRTSTSTKTRKSGVYRPEDNGTKQYYKGDLQSFYSIATNNLSYTNPNKPQGLEDKPNDSRILYVADGGADVFGVLTDVYQLTLGTSESVVPASHTSSHYLGWQPASNSTFFPNINSIRFKSDGTRVFAIGTLRRFASGSSTYYGSVIMIWPLSPAFNISTIQYINDSAFFPSVYYFNGLTSYTSTQVGLYGVDDPYDTRGLSPNGYRIKESFINPDGLIFYYLIDNIIYQGSLSTAWSLSSVSLNQSSLNVGDNTINTFTFNSDGKKLFTFGTTNNRIQQYNLGTAWQISTASLSSTLDLTVSGGNMRIGIRMLNSQSTIVCLSRINNYLSSSSPESDAFLHEINQALY